VLHAINDSQDLELQLIIGGSAVLPKFGVREAITLERLKIRSEVYCTVEGDTHANMATTTGLLTTQLVQQFNMLQPDIVLVHADRYEMLAIATAASYMGIPLAHTQGGEVSGNIDDKVRNAITMLSDIHFPATNSAAQRVYGMGRENIHQVGCPTIDILKKINFGEQEPEPYIMVCMHPVTTDNENHKKIEEIVKVLDYFAIKVKWIHSNIDPMHTQVNQHLENYLKEHKITNIEFLNSVSPEEFYKIMYHSLCLVGNTSSGIREGSYLGTPYVCLGDRQRNREHGYNVRFVEQYDFTDIKEMIDREIGRHYHYDGRFGNGSTGIRIANILADLEVKKCKY
jgi:UDP-hydrolysing UDP-N-acetyl-D-glucosamine 2-epimerase